MEDIDVMVSCSQELPEENAMLEKKLVEFVPFSTEPLSNDADVKFYTGPSKLKMLGVIFDHVKSGVLVSQSHWEIVANMQP